MVVPAYSESGEPTTSAPDSEVHLKHSVLGYHGRFDAASGGNHWCARKGAQHSCSSSDPIHNLQDFPSLNETKLVKSRKKRYGPPFDSRDRWFKYKVFEKDFPFDNINDEAIKLKSAPIEFKWPRTERSRSLINLE